MKYSTKKKAKKAIKKMNCPGAFSSVFENFKWQIMSNITGEIVEIIECQELINKLRMCRSDLDKNIIKIEIQKIASTSTCTAHDGLCNCVELAMEGKPMPWELEYREIDNQPELKLDADE